MAGQMREQWGQQPTNDLSALVNPDVDQVFHVLQERYHNQIIYTNIGDVLVSVNPYQQLPIYGPQVGQSYNGVQSAVSLPPHVFMTACRALRHLRLHGNHQAVLLSGESGSGKTECLKMILSQLGRLSRGIKMSRDSRKPDVSRQVTEAVNLLDLFGNADTGVNNNASRFGKLVDTFWRGDTLVGAEICAHGLEKARVMLSGPGEKNFHVFYNLLAGFDPDMLRQHGHAQSYRILEPYDGGSIFKDREEMKYYKDNYNYLMECLDILGILHKRLRGNEKAGWAIFDVLSAILHLGNVHFSSDPESDSAFIANHFELEAGARLLRLHVQDISAIILTRMSNVRGEHMPSRRDVDGASYARNCLVRHLYSQFFHWLVWAINASLAPAGVDRYQGDLKKIGILDLPGFENLSSNSLEQLHHNLADERLRNHVADLVFRREYDDLERDGVKCQRIKFLENRDTLDAFYDSRAGLLRLMDDLTPPQSNTEGELMKAIKKQTAKKTSVIRVDNSGKTFLIQHHLGQVVYDVDLLLTKNSPTAVTDFRNLVQCSQHPLIREMADVTELPQEGRSGPYGDLDEEGDQYLTTTQKYAISLKDVFRRLEGRETQLLWCVRPNPRGQPHPLDPDTVYRQLLAFNMAETATIRAHGYPVRIPVQEFLDRYKFIAFPLLAHIGVVPSACLRVIRKSGLPDGGWEVRQKKVFLAWWHQDYLDTALERRLRDVVLAQSCVRGHLVRRIYIRKVRESRQDSGELTDFMDDVKDFGSRMFYACQTQNDHNTREMERRYTGRDSGGRRSRHGSQRSRPEGFYNMARDRGYYQNSPRGRYNSSDDMYASYIDSSEDDDTAFTKTVLHGVISKRDLDPSTWCKVICMEYDRPVGKFYVQSREVTIDGSYEAFDGNRAGIGVFRNPDRDRKTENIRGHLGEGLSLSKDSEGSIWARRLTQYDVFVQGHSDPANHCVSADVIINNGVLSPNYAIKVFDMKELKSRVGLELESKTFNKERLQHLCVTGISLLSEEEARLDTPCWLCVVNTTALSSLQTPDVVNQATRLMATVELKTEENEEKDKMISRAKDRHMRKQWSKTDHRDSLNKTEAAWKIRMELRKKGEKVTERMECSWKEDVSGNTPGRSLTIDNLQDATNPDLIMQDGNSLTGHQGRLGLRSSADGRDWAKVKVMRKSSKAKEESEMEAQKRDNMSRY